MHIKLKSILLEEYYGKRGAGVIFFSIKTGRFLFGLRSAEVMESYTWGGFGGKSEGNENPEVTARRESREETGYNPNQLELIYIFEDEEFEYYNYVGIVNDEFDPTLNWENDEYVWVEYGDWPDPLHFGMEKTLIHGRNKLESIISKYKNKEVKEDVYTPPPAIVQHQPAKPPPKEIQTAKKLNDAYVVTATIWGEARGEGYQGMQAVMNVIMNRAKGNFQTARNVVLSPKQFSIWNDISNPEQYSVNLAKKAASNALKDDKSYKQALHIVHQAMTGNLKDITDGATFYFNPKLAQPKWAKKLRFIKKIGNHDFYGIPRNKNRTK
jgi:spore germination cell wall hydrolase CwlJ-like protein/8-oxo-dGTP pyrophosphatase MutT (NUDIX family)